MGGLCPFIWWGFFLLPSLIVGNHAHDGVGGRSSAYAIVPGYTAVPAIPDVLRIPGIAVAEALPAPTPDAVASAQARIDAHGGSLSRDEAEAVLERAGWPRDLVEQALAVSYCESRWSPYAIGDSGNSLGMFQLWRGWFRWAGYPVDAAFDAVVNARVALLVVQRDTGLGREPWAQWSCKP